MNNTQTIGNVLPQFDLENNRETQVRNYNGDSQSAVKGTDWRDIVERNTSTETEDLTHDDPDFILPYCQLDGDLIRKFRDTKLSATGRLAFDYIVMNASNIKQGISRPIDIQGLADFLGVSVRRAYAIIAELESKGFIVPRDKKTRWTYDTPDMKKVHETITDYHKSKVAKKKAEVMKEKIYAVAKIFDKRFGIDGGFGFRPTHHKIMVDILTKHKTHTDILNCLRPAVGRTVTTEHRELIERAFTDIDKQYYQRR